ncbi:latrophilin Cirl [Lucilia cuprina]|uniref:latrophilin Cirl n=1 Tax=Lucilia cuprina TaxID=7375 RepID=UPI001F054248|nr:latrophilin Cirl [Lucilia cuprina]XP_046810691.1 latrophilin Cirl [Lucilia cuprina]XP_046810692.1 latrophilin Cirl [Lucilia cuprina]
MEWSVNCMFPKSLTVLNSRCAHKQSCSVLATTSMFGDPCPGTHKYLEAHYQCISASQTSTTTNRPSPPPWVLSNAPPLLPNGSSSSIINPAVLSPPLPPAQRPQMPIPGMANTNLPLGGVGNMPPNSVVPSSPGPPTIHTTLPGGRLKAGSYNSTALKTPTRHDGLPPPPPLHHHHHSATNGGHHPSNDQGKEGGGPPTRGGEQQQQHLHKTESKTSKAPVSNNNSNSNTTAPPNTRILTGVGGTGSDDGTLLTTKTTTRGQQQQQQQQSPPTGTTTASSLGSLNTTLGAGIIKSINNINLNSGLGGEDETNMFCGPTNARNLFWNMTRVGDVNVQPCPGGATGIAKWRCVLMKRITLDDEEDSASSTQTPICNGTSCLNLRLRNFEPTWHPLTPDLTQCRSLWLNNLEVRVNHRDSSLISIANDLSEVTSSKTLYGGDMLVTTKIIQAMSEKMYHDKETFPDQRLREAMILELLQGVVKTGSNLLDESQLSSWLDLNQEDQMRVATSLLTGLEDNAFLLADTIIRERNVVQKVKNILLSVRVLETKSIQNNEVFPDAEQWQISDDRIELPRAALIENSEGGLVRIVFAAFDRLESILKPSYDHFDLKSARSYIRNTAILANDSDASSSQQRIRILNSKVISASLGKGRHIQLSQPIKLVLRHLKTENVTNPTCVFWNYIDHAWSANGCILESTNRTHSICMCNHLTNFAILMDVMDDHTHSLFTMFDGNMRILIYVSISICLVFIVIALLTLKIFNGVFIKSARTSIYRNIYICLLLIEVLFLIGIEQVEANIIFCGFTTVFLHCAILTAIAWFCFEAFQSYTTLTTDDILLEVDQTSKVNCYYLLSYALSFTIVAISLAINPSTYTENDYCVLMETNFLFYATFVTPLMIFLMGALGYTFLSWIIMCRKSRTALKNKEHTRLANVRFDIRCSFIFLLLLCGAWFTAYFYLRRSKLDDEMSQIYGYLFVGFNTMMGIYIFVFHCIQNEKIRREYRKYVRQNSWLPKCLRCSKTSISSGIVGGSACGMNSAGNTGTLNSNTNALVSSTGTQLKKSKIPLGDANENDETGNIISATEDAIMASSDCELNEGSKTRRQGSSSNSSAVGGIVATAGTIKSGIMPGNLVLQHTNKTNDPTLQGHVIMERNTGPGTTGTLRSTGGLRTPSAGHTSPTSSVSSTHLIFGQGHKQQQLAAGSMNGVVPPPTQEAFYHQPDYYAWQKANSKQAAQQGQVRDYHGSGISPQQQQQQSHEFFYWTQKHNQGHSKKKRGSNTGSDSPSGSLHSRNTATSQQILFYPSYKKTAMKQPTPSAPHSYYAEALDPGAPPPHYQQQLQQQRRPPHAYQQHQQQQQLSSDDEQMEHAAHAHLLQQMNRRGPGPGEFALSQTAGPQQQRYYRNKHSNCDLNQPMSGGGGGAETYYNQGSLASDNGPVYEEILSNRTSDVQHYNVDDLLPQHHDYEDERAMQLAYQRQQQQHHQQQQRLMKQRYNHNGGGGIVSGPPTGGVMLPGKMPSRSHHDYVDDFEGHEAESPYTDDEDDEEEEEDEEPDDEGSDDHLPPQSDERMRRLMAMQDADFQRRFQRQLRKNAQANEQTATGPPSYNDYHEPQYPLPPVQPQQQLQQQQQPITVFGVSSGAGGSVRSFKKTTTANGSRLAVNELFATTHGPPLPPANQHPMQKKQQQQQQQQQISPQSVNNMPVVGRNISAMLDENNTVRCYLEPLEK